MNAETIINETVKIIVPTGSPVCTAFFFFALTLRPSAGRVSRLAASRLSIP